MVELKMLKSSGYLWKTSGVSNINELVELAPMGEAFYEERSLLPGRFNKHVWITTWWNLLELPNFTMIRLLDDDDKARGALGAIATPDLNTGELMAIEQFWYVDRQARGKGLLLLTAFEEWAMSQGAVRCTIGHIWDEDRGEAWKRLFAMKHYLPLEIHYSKELA
jgi:hypothetical protein